MGAVLIVLGLVAAAMTIMPAALSSESGTLVIQGPGPVTFITATISGTSSWNGTYGAWCVDNEHPLLTGVSYGAVVDAPGAVDKPQNLDLVNWLLNNIPGGYGWWDVQLAIWLLIDNNPTPPSTEATALAEAAIANGEGFVPGCGQYYLVVVAPTLEDGSPGQAIIIVLQRDPCPRYGRIIVNKVTLPVGAPAQSFNFDSSWGPDFSLVNGGAMDSGLLVAPAIHSISELGPLPEGWSLTSATCNDGSAPSAIGLSPDEVVTCTFVNTFEQTEGPKGSLTIIKVATALDPADATSFPFDGTLGSFSLADGESQTYAELDPGAYAVAETVPASSNPGFEWKFDNVQCTADDWEADPAGDPSVTVNLGLGEAAVCTFYNYQERVLGPAGSLTIVKQTIPSGGTGFGFDAGDLGTFTLDDGGSELFTDLAAGAYTVTETPADDWEFAQVDCTAADWEASGPSVTVNLAEGEAAVCTFTNGQLPYTGGQPLMFPLLVAGLWSVLMGLGMMVWSTMRRASA